MISKPVAPTGRTAAMIMSLLLDLVNILGGLLLAIPLLGRAPVVGHDLGRFAAKMAPWRWIIGVIALVAGGYFLIVHAFSGPNVFHFEIVGIAVGICLAWERLTGRTPIAPEPGTDATGRWLALGIFGVIAIIVGLQGLVTPN
ncbi:hypothetical protein [Actinoplanes rectilineatus]|uniref:hypothetical protein n=1 Tax=Actinoplanes rectilineatus TaxID=113571 RepID=UPI001FE01BDF|nr:hypothetical protein [Actinoplanes rectilineatus]